MQLALVANSDFELHDSSHQTYWVLNEKGLEQHIVEK
jgi:hypothetical protein